MRLTPGQPSVRPTRGTATQCRNRCVVVSDQPVHVANRQRTLIAVNGQRNATRDSRPPAFGWRTRKKEARRGDRALGDRPMGDWTASDFNGSIASFQPELGPVTSTLSNHYYRVLARQNKARRRFFLSGLLISEESVTELRNYLKRWSTNAGAHSKTKNFVPLRGSGFYGGFGLYQGTGFLTQGSICRHRHDYATKLTPTSCNLYCPSRCRGKERGAEPWTIP